MVSKVKTSITTPRCGHRDLASAWRWKLLRNWAADAVAVLPQKAGWILRQLRLLAKVYVNTSSLSSLSFLLDLPVQSMPAQKKTLTRHSTSEFGKKWLGNISHIETFLYFQIYQAPPHCQSRSAEDFRLLSLLSAWIARQGTPRRFQAVFKTASASDATKNLARRPATEQQTWNFHWWTSADFRN